MVLYAVYRASEEFKNRRLIPKHLKALGCRCVRRSFWEVDDEKVNDVLRVLKRNEPILLKRLREIRKPQFDEKNNLTDLGSLVVFVYKSGGKDEIDKIRNLLKRAPCIRLCRGVYAFYQEHSNFDSKGELIGARLFWSLAREDGNIKVFPRMIIVNPESVTKLLEKITLRIEKGIDDVVAGYEDLYQRAIKGEIGKKDIREERLKLDRKFSSMKKLAKFYRKWLGIDFSKITTKPYTLIRKTRLMNTE